MDPEKLPKVNLTKDAPNISLSDLHHMKKFEKINLKRVKDLVEYRKKNRIVGSLLVIGVLSIYTYTICSVKQESFLDDFEVPQTTANDKF